MYALVGLIKASTWLLGCGCVFLECGLCSRRRL